MPALVAGESAGEGTGLGAAGLAAAAGLAGAALAKVTAGEAEEGAPAEAPEGASEPMTLEAAATEEAGPALSAAGLAAAGLIGAAVAKSVGEETHTAKEAPAAVLTVGDVTASLPETEIEAAPLEASLASAELGAPYVRAEPPAGDLSATEAAALELGERPADLAVPGIAAAAGALAAGAVGVAAGKTLAEPSAAAAAVEPGAATVAAAAAGMQAAEETEAGAPATLGAAAAPATGARDDLTLIRGIGPKYATQLAAAGITTFAALAAASPEELQQAVNAPTWQKPDYAGWIAEAKVWEKQRGSIGDDLLIIEGIGPVYAAKLRAAGVTTFAQLAQTDDARLAEIIQAPAWRRAAYGEWREQARLAAAGDAAGLKALQDRLFARSDEDKLTLIAGVGEKTAAALAAAGITTFAALADSSPDELDKTVKLAGVRGGDYDAWIAEAKQRAAGERVVRAQKPESCPQDLSRVAGIGASYEKKLYEAGIGAYWQLSILTHEELSYILDVQEFQQVDLAGIKEDALRLAQETGTVERTWDGTPPDDLELVEGIGDTYEGRLYDAGICTYAALAATTPERLAEICKAPEFARPDYASWIAQAAGFVGKRARGVKHLAACPEDLSRVKGIGAVYETKLYEAGIGSYWELAQTDEAELRRILGIKEFQKVDLSAITSDAQRLAEETQTVGRGWTGTAPDDFETLEGMGAVYEGRLYAAGICTFRALSNATVEQLADICKAPAFRTPDYASWIAQAKVIVTQRGR